ncbi:MAG: GNAT family N-acetyltransferase [Coriobacteriia bacterium]|nr:GNAT family N-acetyltransferase [Coriobacteriia bacterium]
MDLEFAPVQAGADQELLAKLAAEIWFEYWPNLIGLDQTRYMVEKFQSLEAIRRDMTEHAYEYWFICANDGETGEWATSDGKHIVGFTGGHVEPETNRFFISKIYLLSCERGKHYASHAIQFYTQLCQQRGLRAMYLTVNKYNELGIRAYKGKGFEVIDAVETDIGNGFIMDDYIMEKQA